MFQYKLLIVLVVATVGLCVPLGKSFEPERCCAPKQFSSKMSLSTGMVLSDGTVISLFGHYNFSYDQNRSMVGMKGVSINVMNDQKSNLWIIQNGNTGITYTIDMDTKHCDKSHIQMEQIRCIPQSATYLYSSNYGYGDKQIIGDTWLIKMNGTINYSTVSRGDCIPLTGHLYMQDPRLVDTLTTTDYIGRIIDPSVFDIPAECQQLI